MFVRIPWDEQKRVQFYQGEACCNHPIPFKEVSKIEPLQTSVVIIINFSLLTAN